MCVPTSSAVGRQENVVPEGLSVQGSTGPWEEPGGPPPEFSVISSNWESRARTV